MTVTDNQIRVFCPKHEFPFVTKATAEIQCRMDAHALSLNFPQGEWWEFCCDCQTFFPSLLNDAKSAEAKCPSCERLIARRFACSQCKIVALESENGEREKNYRIDLKKGIEPACPACQTVAADVDQHDCVKIGTMFLTERQSCPFCEKTIRSIAAAVQPLKEAAGCLQCAAPLVENSPFCGKCGFPVQTNVLVEKRGTEINKTKLLGSLCPNCSTPIPPDSGFCGECGQAVKKAVAPPPPPPPRKNDIGNTSAAFSETLGGENPPSDLKKDNLLKILVGVGAGVLLLVIISSVISSSNTNSVNKNSSAPTNTVSTNSAMNNVSSYSTKTTVSISKTPNKSNSDYRIGKTGTLAVDANLRERANKDSYLLGTHYRGAKVKILDVTTVTNSNGSTTDWYKIEVTSYGNSMDPNKYGQSGKDPDSEDVGWVNSYPQVYEGTRSTRINLVELD